MSIVKYKYQQNFAIIPNYHFKDSRLTPEAIGYFSYMLQCPDDWEFTIKGLAEAFNGGEYKVSSALKVLEKCGYLERKYQRQAGKFTGIDYILYPCPKDKLEEFGYKPMREEPEQTIQEEESEEKTGNMTVKDIDDLYYESVCEKCDRQENISHELENYFRDFFENTYSDKYAEDGDFILHVMSSLIDESAQNKCKYNFKHYNLEDTLKIISSINSREFSRLVSTLHYSFDIVNRSSFMRACILRREVKDTGITQEQKDILEKIKGIYDKKPR